MVMVCEAAGGEPQQDRAVFCVWQAWGDPQAREAFKAVARMACSMCFSTGVCVLAETQRAVIERGNQT
jgi:hypothetical protein